MRGEQHGVQHDGPAPKQPWSHTDDLLTVLDALDVECPVLVGSSDGGRKALDFALAHPDRVAGLVLAGCALLLPDPDTGEQAAFDALRAALAPRTAAVERGDTDAAVRHDLDVWAPRAAPAHRALLERLYADSLGFLTGWDVEPLPAAEPGIEHLDRITAPALVLIGGHDTAFTHRCADRLTRGLPDARRIDLPDADHFPNLSAPDDFHRAVTAFAAGTVFAGG
ncbi:alpha/beta fold hydrolase [Kitasatospora terrestris]|uniref:alpha/beta fold hydrolase n=1 Tax=Kitasatospora terrestris TaxID=258051 RepID=UPI003CD0C3D5